jgi:hypothetical protein
MKYNTKDIKEMLKTGLVLYTLLGSAYIHAGNLTGHQSADLYTERAKPTQLEKSVFNPLFQKLGIESKIFEEQE